MIECPKCKSDKVSIISVTISEKRPINIVNKIQRISVGITFLNIALIALMMRSLNFEDLGTIILEIFINTGIQMIGILSGVYICLTIIKWSLIIIVICAFVKIVTPYYTYSYEKCICHQCEFQWQYSIRKSAPQEQEKQNKTIYLH